MKNYFTIHFRLFCKLLLLLALPFTSIAQLDYYWVGGTGDWSDYANHWATSSGGTSFHTSIPSDVDNVYFDENSFTAEGQVVTLDISGFTDNRIHNMDWRGSQFSPALVSEPGTINYLRIHGSVYFQENMSVDVVELGIQILSEDVSAEFDPNGVDLSNTSIHYIVKESTSSLSLLDSLSAKSFTMGNTIGGSFTTNGHSIHVLEDFAITKNIESSGVVDISNSNIYAKSIKVSSNVLGGILNTDNASVDILYPDGMTELRIFDSEPLFDTYSIREDHLIEEVAGDVALFNKLTLESGVKLLIDSSIPGVEFETLEAKGSQNNLITIKSDDASTAVTLIQSEGEVNMEWVALQDVTGTGGATFNAFVSEDNGNVTGINFLKFSQTIDLSLVTKSYDNVGEVYVPSVSATSGLDVTLQSSDASVAEVSNGNELIIKGAGTTSITANQLGNDYYDAADPVTVDFVVTKIGQVISMDIQDTWIGEDFLNPNATSSSGLDVDYSVIGPAQFNDTTLLLTGIGTVQVTASQSGNENYLPADDVIVSFEVFKKGQTITFAEIENTWIGEEFVNLNTSVSSGLMLDYQVSGPATHNGNVLEFTGTGTVQVTASQIGNENYLPADDVIVSFEVFKKGQTITFAEIPDTSEDDGFVNLEASSDAGLPISFSVVGPVNEVNGVLEFTGNGMVQVTAIQEGDDLYLAADEVKRSFEILASETEKPLFLTQPEGLGLVYPNPVADYLYFDPQVSIESIIVRDLMGKTFYEGDLEQHYLDMSQYESGVYMLTVKQTDGEEIIKRIKVN